MFSIRIWKGGGLNAKLIWIKFTNCDKTVTYHLVSEEYLNSVFYSFSCPFSVIRMLDYCEKLRTIITTSLKWI